MEMIFLFLGGNLYVHRIQSHTIYYMSLKNSFNGGVIRNSFENLGKTKPQQACCFLMEVPTTTGKDTYGQYADIKILDKNNNCLNC